MPKSLILLIINLLTLCYGYSYGRLKKSLQCRPSDDQLKTFGMITSLSNESHPFGNVKPLDTGTFLHHGHTYVTADTECVFPSVIASDARLKERSVCPWDWRVNYNPLRIPQAFLEARCKCDKMKEFFRGSGDKVMYRYFECEQVYFAIKVLLYKSDCSEYTETVEEVPLACVALNDIGTRMVFGDMRSDEIVVEI